MDWSLFSSRGTELTIFLFPISSTWKPLPNGAKVLIDRSTSSLLVQTEKKKKEAKVGSTAWNPVSCTSTTERERLLKSCLLCDFHASVLDHAGPFTVSRFCRGLVVPYTSHPFDTTFDF